MENKEEKIFKFKKTIEGVEYSFAVDGCSTLEEAKNKLVSHLLIITDELNDKI